MAKPIPSSGSGAIRIILKNKEDFHFDLRDTSEEDGRISYRYDVFYENVTGTLNIVVNEGEIIIAALNLSVGKVITLHNDASLRKLCAYVLEGK